MWTARPEMEKRPGRAVHISGKTYPKGFSYFIASF